MMPEMDGYAVCARLQAHDETAFIPTVFVTTLDAEQDKARAFALGADTGQETGATPDRPLSRLPALAA